MFGIQLTKAKKLIKSAKLLGAANTPKVEIKFKDKSIAALISIMADMPVKGDTVTLALKDATKEQLLQFLALTSTK